MRLIYLAKLHLHILQCHHSHKPGTHPTPYTVWHCTQLSQYYWPYSLLMLYFSPLGLFPQLGVRTFLIPLTPQPRLPQLIWRPPICSLYLCFFLFSLFLPFVFRIPHISEITISCFLEFLKFLLIKMLEKLIFFILRSWEFSPKFTIKMHKVK